MERSKTNGSGNQVRIRYSSLIFSSFHGYNVSNKRCHPNSYANKECPSSFTPYSRNQVLLYEKLREAFYGVKWWNI